ncbi:MAG TPA: hypothetical protein VGA71_04355 [Actinomycetota bacterium]
MDAGNQIPLREPPEGFLTPRDVDRVVAILDDPAQVSEAIKDLAREGFDQEEIVVLSGPEGAARVEAPDQQRGLRGRLSRYAEFVLGDEPEERDRYAQELAAGRFLLAVPADEGRKAQVAQVLGRHGAHDMEHFGEYHGEPLGSSRNEVGT